MLNKCTQTDNPSFSNNFVQTEEIALNTDDTQRLEHHICSTFHTKTRLPCIEVKLNKIKSMALLDSGSTLCLIDDKYFQTIKHEINYKYLSNKVNISTINSKVEFKGCIMLSFKIDNCFFKHNLYIADICSDFQLILGYDFMLKNNMSLTPGFKSALLKDLVIPFISETKDGQYVNHIDSSFSTDESVISADNVTDKGVNKESLKNEPEIIVQNFRKVRIPKKSCVYVRAKFSSEPSQYFLYVPELKSSEVVGHESLHSLPHIKNNAFVIILENTSDKTIHLNKNARLGTINNVAEEHIQSYTFDEVEQHHCNLIVPSDEIIQKRINDLSPDDFDLNHLTSEQREVMINLLRGKAQAFSKSLDTIGQTDLVSPHIELLNSHPIKALPFPVPQALQQEALDQIQEMLRANIIKRSNSSWACPMLLVKKKKTSPSQPQKYRLALDLRLLNAIIIPSSYPLPKISNLLLQLSQYKFFTTLDLPSAYWQIAVPKDLQDKLSFTTPWGVFTFRVLVFGLKTAASTFQELIDTLIQESGVDSCFAYQDDLVVGANSFQEMLDKLDKLLNVFIKNNVTLSPEKSSFFKTDITFLGFYIKDHKIFPIQSNITKIVEFPTPKTKRQTKAFVGLCSFYRSLIPSFSDLVAPLIEITKPKLKFVWDNEQESAFQALQKIFFNEPVLHLPNWDEKFYVNTDASKQAISAVLMQKRNGMLLPVAYYSKLLTDAEKKFPPIKLELYAIYKGITSFKYYLFNRQFTVLSDAKPLNKYKKTNSPADVTTRWLMELSEFSFNFQHVPGKENVLADYLSRCPTAPPYQDLNSNPELLSASEPLPVTNTENDLHNEVQPQVVASQTNFQNQTQHPNHFVNVVQSENNDPPLEILDETLLNEQLADPKLSKIIHDLKNGKQDKKLTGYYIHPESQLLCFFKDYARINTDLHRAVVPASLQEKALTIAHVSHTGIQKTLQNLRKRFTWQHFVADTYNFVQSCEVCLLNKPLKTNKAPLLASPVPTAPNQKVSMDILGPIKGNHYLLPIVDHFSRHMELYHLNSITAPTITKALLHYIATHGRPEFLLCDRGKQFTSDLLKSFNKLLGICLKHSSIAHPQANGISERLNPQIKSSILTMASQGFDIGTAAKVHQSIYNATTHPATKFSPNFLHFGREISDIYFNYKNQPNWRINDNQEIADIAKNFDQVYFHAYQNNENSRQDLYAKSRVNRQFPKIDIGDTVYVKCPNIFEKKMQGPYSVQKIISPAMLQLLSQDDPQISPLLVHTDRIVKLHKRKPKFKSQSSDKRIPDTTNDCNQPGTSRQTSRIFTPSRPVQSDYTLRQKRNIVKPHNDDYVYYR